MAIIDASKSYIDVIADIHTYIYTQEIAWRK